jgi:hypothetical protein
MTPSPVATLVDITAAERDYLRNLGYSVPTMMVDISDSELAAALATGRQICGTGDDADYEGSTIDYIGPPSVNDLIELRDSDLQDAKPAITHLCPKYLPRLHQARTGFMDTAPTPSARTSSRAPTAPRRDASPTATGSGPPPAATPSSTTGSTTPRPG